MITGKIWTLNVGQNTFKLSDIVFIECAGKRSNKRWNKLVDKRIENLLKSLYMLIFRVVLGQGKTEDLLMTPNNLILKTC